MKVEVVENETFQPVTLTITITSKDELIDLYNKTRLSPKDVSRAFKSYGYSERISPSDINNSHTTELYNKIISILTERKYFKD